MIVDHRKWLWILLLAAGLGCIGPVPAQERAPAAVAVVERLQEALLEAMRNAASLGFSGRYDLLEPVVRRTHDLPAMAGFVLGRHGRTLSAEQRRRFEEAFAAFSVATYASRFDDYGGERFEQRGLQRRSAERVSVRTALIKPDGDEVRLDYLLQRSGDWQIVNVVADGVSDLAVRRSEIDHIIRTEGFEAAIDALRDKVRARSE